MNNKVDSKLIELTPIVIEAIEVKSKTLRSGKKGGVIDIVLQSYDSDILPQKLSVKKVFDIEQYDRAGIDKILGELVNYCADAIDRKLYNDVHAENQNLNILYDVGFGEVCPPTSEIVNFGSTGFYSHDSSGGMYSFELYIVFVPIVKGD